MLNAVAQLPAEQRVRVSAAGRGRPQRRGDRRRHRIELRNGQEPAALCPGQTATAAVGIRMTPNDDTRDEELLARYRRAGADAAGPSDAVRAAILAESRRVADELAKRAPQPHALMYRVRRPTIRAGKSRPSAPSAPRCSPHFFLRRATGKTRPRLRREHGACAGIRAAPAPARRQRLQAAPCSQVGRGSSLTRHRIRRPASFESVQLRAIAKPCRTCARRAAAQLWRRITRPRRLPQRLRSNLAAAPPAPAARIRTLDPSARPVKATGSSSVRMAPLAPTAR